MNDFLNRMASKGILDEQAVLRVEALTAQNRPLDEALVSASGLPEERVLQLLADEFHVPYVDLDQRQPSKEFLALFPVRILLERHLLPLCEEDGAVIVASS